MKSLPLLVNEDNKYQAGLLLWAFATLIYLASNHFPLFPPRMLPMTWIDQAVPFRPGTVWIYISEYLYFVVIFLICKERLNLNRYIYAFVGLQVTSVLIFFAWPTTYPRHLFPLPETLDPVTTFVFSTLREADTPNNCFPSLHVSSVYLSAFIFLEEQKKKFPFFFCWGSAIAFSTLTTKQHYLADVLSGLVMAVIFYWLFYRVIRYRSLGYRHA